MPFIQEGIRKHKKDLPIEEVELSCEVLGSLLVDKNRKGLKVYCEQFAQRFASDILSFDFSSSHTKLGHSVKVTGLITVDGIEHEEKKQTPYYSEDEYSPAEAGVMMFRDLVHAILSITEKFNEVVFFKDYEYFRDMEQSSFEILRRDYHEGDSIPEAPRRSPEEETG